MADEEAKFWNAFEKETGEKVEARSEGDWIHIPETGATREGLLILTDKSFRFKYVPDTLRPLMGAGIPPSSRIDPSLPSRVATSSPCACRSEVFSRGLFAALSRAAPLSHGAKAVRKPTCFRSTLRADSSAHWRRAGLPLGAWSFTEPNGRLCLG